jgi:hypothetical protein
MSNPYDTQVGGNHYQTMKIQPAEFINKNEMKFAEGNAIKYICRHVNKGGLQDLQKAKHYIDMIIERDYEKESKGSSVDSGLDINIEDVKISYANEELNGAIYYPSGASVGQEGFDE